MPLNFDSLTVDDECFARISVALIKNCLWMNGLPREDIEDPSLCESSVVMQFTPVLGRLTYVQSACGNYPVNDAAGLVFWLNLRFGREISFGASG